MCIQKIYLANVRKYAPAVLKSQNHSCATDSDALGTPVNDRTRQLRKTIRELESELFDLNSALQSVEVESTKFQRQILSALSAHLLTSVVEINAIASLQNYHRILPV